MPDMGAGTTLVALAVILGAKARLCRSRGCHPVVVKDASSVHALVANRGAQTCAAQCDSEPVPGTHRASLNSGIVEYNRERTIVAAAAMLPRVERALEILGPAAPLELRMVGLLGMRCPDASMST